jgi:hypothetical protein
LNVPEIFPTLRVLVVLSQDLTYAVVPDVSPVTTSLNMYVPIPVIDAGSAIVNVGSAS